MSLVNTHTPTYLPTYEGIVQLFLVWRFVFQPYTLRCSFPELNNKGEWAKHSYFEHFDQFTIFEDTVERIDVRAVTPQAFIDSYESLYKPVVITHVQETWKANEKWTLEVLFSRHSAPQTCSNTAEKIGTCGICLLID